MRHQCSKAFPSLTVQLGRSGLGFCGSSGSALPLRQSDGSTGRLEGDRCRGDRPGSERGAVGGNLGSDAESGRERTLLSSIDGDDQE